MHLELGNHLETGSMFEGRAVPATTGLAGSFEHVISVSFWDTALPFAIGMGWDSQNRPNR